MRITNRSPFNRTTPDLRIVRNDASEDTADVFLYEEIGFWGIDAQTFTKELRALDVSTIHLHVNSPGGSVFDGMAIANALREHKARIVVHIDALAASIASVIALAGDEIIMADNAFFMIHNAWTIIMGNAADLRKEAALLDKIDGAIVNEYVKQTGQEVDVIKEWMAEEKWFDAQEALDAGFIDSIAGESGADAEDAAASFDLSVYAKVPSRLAARARRKEKPTAKDAERALRDAGFSRTEAKKVIAAGLHPTSDATDGADEVLNAMRRLLDTVAQ
jgi:ATP-dependent protease ClpP protease subunit